MTTQTKSTITVKDLMGIAGTDEIDVLVNHIRLSKKLIDTLNSGMSVGFFPISNGNTYHFKCVDFPLGDWLRYSGQISKDFFTPLDALEHYVTNKR